MMANRYNKVNVPVKSEAPQKVLYRIPKINNPYTDNIINELTQTIDEIPSMSKIKNNVYVTGTKDIGKNTMYQLFSVLYDSSKLEFSDKKIPKGLLANNCIVMGDGEESGCRINVNIDSGEIIVNEEIVEPIVIQEIKKISIEKFLRSYSTVHTNPPGIPLNMTLIEQFDRYYIDEPFDQPLSQWISVRNVPMLIPEIESLGVLPDEERMMTRMYFLPKDETAYKTVAKILYRLFWFKCSVDARISFATKSLMNDVKTIVVDVTNNGIENTIDKIVNAYHGESATYLIQELKPNIMEINHKGIYSRLIPIQYTDGTTKNSLGIATGNIMVSTIIPKFLALPESIAGVVTKGVLNFTKDNVPSEIELFVLSSRVKKLM